VDLAGAAVTPVLAPVPVVQVLSRVIPAMVALDPAKGAVALDLAAVPEDPDMVAVGLVITCKMAVTRRRNSHGYR